MLDNGYALVRIELLNWGNFHGLQKFQLRSERDDGLLFAAPSASAILGVNGSGKSTLIDALMIALLPFEGSVKLGVTNDVETGSAGGRTIRDYVLGKHSSTTGREGTLAASMGRRDGCSFVLLVFQHNRNKSKMITIGRVWWYQNHVVSETQLAFLAYDTVGVQQLCPDGKTPRSAKFFRQHCREILPHLQTFETMQSYFAALSGSFGKISRDDLKILNRAFYVKSISQIDQFIRENMLIEQESPHLDRLLENVRNGQEIAFAIETCEKKIGFIERIVKDLKKLEQISHQRKGLERRDALLTIFDDWTQLRQSAQELIRLKSEIEETETKIPEIRRSVADAERYLSSVQSQIVHNDLDARLQKSAIEIQFLKERQERTEAQLALAETKALRLSIKLPKRSEGWRSFRLEIDEKVSLISATVEKLKADIYLQQQSKFKLDQQAKEIRDELEHLSRFKTLLPPELYGIKEDAMKTLGIPAGQLCFVGELIQVMPEFKQYQRATESVLFPIARNLLCHPDHLSTFTKWLDERGLKSDLVAKRITTDELQSEDGSWNGSERRLGVQQRSKARNKATHVSSAQRTYEAQLNGQSEELFILDMIAVLPERNHSFTRYLWQWLRAKFDYRIATVKEFRGSEENLVTIEGLVKSDHRTMRKLKQSFRFSLGWDNAERIEELSRELLELNSKDAVLKKGLTDRTQSLQTHEERSHFFEELKTRAPEFELLEQDRNRAQELAQERENLIRENPDFKQLKERELEITTKLKELQKKESTAEASIEAKTKHVATLATLLPQKERELKQSLVYGRLLLDLGGEPEVDSSLSAVATEITKNKTSKLQMVSELKSELQNLESAAERTRTSAAASLTGFKRDFNDPNLSYVVPESSLISELAFQWVQAEERLRRTELPLAQEKWRRFFDQIMMDSVKDTINEVKSKIDDVERSIRSINDVLKLTNFEDLPDDQRYLLIHIENSRDERIRRFKRSIVEIEKILGPGIRAQVETQSQMIMGVLVPFVEEFQKETAYRTFVTDVRNHFQFEVHSLRRKPDGADEVIEVFTGARRDAKSSAQTTQLAYALLASCLAYRFKFHDPVGSQETPRLLILDEFGGKFDNEKPREILKLLDKMGFQSILVSPMSKADLLAEAISHLVFVHKVSATHSKVQSYEVTSKSEYDRLVSNMTGAIP